MGRFAAEAALSFLWTQHSKADSFFLKMPHIGPHPNLFGLPWNRVAYLAWLLPTFTDWQPTNERSLACRYRVCIFCLNFHALVSLFYFIFLYSHVFNDTRMVVLLLLTRRIQKLLLPLSVFMSSAFLRWCLGGFVGRGFILNEPSFLCWNQNYSTSSLGCLEAILVYIQVFKGSPHTAYASSSWPRTFCH